LASDPEAAGLFCFAGGAPSGISASDAASGFDVPVCGIQVRVPRSFSLRESSYKYKLKSLGKFAGMKGKR
jgi:hypothetical protein